MRIKQQTLETMKIASLIVVLASLLFVITAWAQAQETEVAAEAETSAEQNAQDSGIGASPNLGKDARQLRRALRNARRQERREYAQQQRAAKLAASQSQAGQISLARPPAPLRDIQVSFKLDPRLTRGLYMGDRWVSSPTYVGTVGQDTVEVRAKGIDANGVASQISPRWTPEDSKMVTVSAGQGNAVLISVHRAGESTLKVESAGVSKILTIKATELKNKVLQVEISQTPERTAALRPQASSNNN